LARVRKSTVIDAPIEAVWNLLRDFNGQAGWHPSVAASAIEEQWPPDAIGSVRAFSLTDGTQLREQLLALSDRHKSLTYCLLESPVPLIGYVATIRLKRITEGERTFWSWESTFAAPAGQEHDLEALVGEEIYRAGFVAVQSRLARSEQKLPGSPSPREVSARTPSAAPVRPGGPSRQTDAIVVERHGGPEVLRLRRVAVAPPAPGEVRLRQTAIGVNFIDVYCRTGYFSLLTPPGIPGMEAAGVVEEVGLGVPDLRPGDRVGYACPPVGAYAGLRTMSARLLVPLPGDIDDATAAAVLLKGFSADFLLSRVHAVAKGETVLIHAAAGGVGLLMCQLAHARGAIVIGTVSSDQKADLARRFGCRHPIVGRGRDFAAEVREITDGRGADVIYDAIGRDTFGESLEALAMCGHLVSFGQASGPIGAWDVDRFTSKSATVSRPNFAHYTDTPEKVRDLADRLFGAIRTQQLRVTIGRRLPLADAAEAHRSLEARATVGSTLLLPDAGRA
jgi:NADPH2:quinone reductase